MKKILARLRVALYYISITGVGALAIWFVISWNCTLSMQKNVLQLPGIYFQTNSFFDSLFNQAIRNLKQPAALLVVQIAVIIVVSRIVAYLISFIGQPAVIGETIGGILLGPSMLGLFAPGISHFLFPAVSILRLEALSQLGIIVYMFLVGMEIDFGKLKEKAGNTLLISHTGIVIPFVFGIFISIYLYKQLAPTAIPFLSFALFIGVAMKSITAFPVLARIVKEKRLNDTMLGTLSLASAAIGDVTAWFLLAIVISVSKASSIATAFISVAFVGLFIAIMFFAVRPFLDRYFHATRGKNQGSIFSVTIIVLILLFSSAITNMLGVHAIFGAFMAGLCMPADMKFRMGLKEKMEDFSLIFLLPLFFALMGLKTQIGLLNSYYLWSVFGLILIVAVAGKFGGVLLAARFSRMKWRDSIALGVLMNTRGLMELIALNIGYELGIISPAIFTMMVMMAIITTCMTGPLLNLILRKQS